MIARMVSAWTKIDTSQRARNKLLWRYLDNKDNQTREDESKKERTQT